MCPQSDHVNKTFSVINTNGQLGSESSGNIFLERLNLHKHFFFLCMSYTIKNCISYRHLSLNTIKKFGVSTFFFIFSLFIINVFNSAKNWIFHYLLLMYLIQQKI